MKRLSIVSLGIWRIVSIVLAALLAEAQLTTDSNVRDGYLKSSMSASNPSSLSNFIDYGLDSLVEYNLDPRIQEAMMGTKSAHGDHIKAKTSFPYQLRGSEDDKELEGTSLLQPSLTTRPSVDARSVFGIPSDNVRSSIGDHLMGHEASLNHISAAKEEAHSGVKPVTGDYSVPDESITFTEYEDADNKTSVSKSNVNKKSIDKREFGKKFKYDPALILMGLGKRAYQYDPALKYMGLGKRGSQYDPALKYMGLGKRSSQYDPALNYMGLGKRGSQFDPALKYMGLGKKDIPYDSELKYMDLEKRTSQYDPALKYMGLGKRVGQYDPALKYMGLGKRKVEYDPFLKYMGLGKRNMQYDPALKYMGLGKRSEKDLDFENIKSKNEEFNYDPALNYMGLENRRESNSHLNNMVESKRWDSYDPALKYMGLGKRHLNYDPALKYMGLGKRNNKYDPALNYIGLGKRNYKFDPALKYMGLGKRGFHYDPALKYMGLGKRDFTYDPALRYMGLGKRNVIKDELNDRPQSSKGFSSDELFKNVNKSVIPKEIATNLKNSFDFSNKISSEKRVVQYDPGLRYIGLGKKLMGFPSVRLMRLGKKGYNYDPALRYMGLGKKGYNFDPALKYMGLGKKAFNYDPALKYMGLGKRESGFHNLDNFKGLGKRPYKFDPALKFMGLGKRLDRSETKMVDISPKNDPEIDSNESDNKLFDTLQEYNIVDTKNKGHDKTEDTEMNQSIKGDIVSENGNLDLLNAFEKRSDKLDPALKYMGLGKREINYNKAFTLVESERPKRQISSKPVNECGGDCLSRHKRDVSDILLNDVTPDHKTKSSVITYELTDPAMKELSENLENQIYPEKVGIEKRERDNRPKYNPGWIFIGLGKRTLLPLEGKYSNEVPKDTNTSPMSNQDALINTYKKLLRKIKDNILGFNSRITNDPLFQASFINLINKEENLVRDFNSEMDPTETKKTVGNNREFLQSLYNKMIRDVIGNILAFKYRIASDPLFQVYVPTSENEEVLVPDIRSNVVEPNFLSPHFQGPRYTLTAEKSFLASGRNMYLPATHIADFEA